GTNYLVTSDNVISDPPVGLVYGNVLNNGGSGVIGVLSTPDVDEVRITYSIALASGQSATLIHVAILGAPTAAGKAYAIGRSSTLVSVGYAGQDSLLNTSCA